MTTNHNPKAGEPEVVTTIRLSKSDHQRLREIATAQHRSLSQEVRRLVELRIAEFADEPSEAAA